MDLNRAQEELIKLQEVVYELRQKCPWDKEQTWESLRQMTIEETFELTDAILEGDKKEIRKELGDVFLHILFYAMIAEEELSFDFADVCESLRVKLIERHPHIYGEVQVNNSAEVKQNWEKIKLKTGSKSVLSGVPKSLPSLIKASRLQDKASSVGFDWSERHQVLDKVKEELAELEEAIGSESKEHIEAEFGDLLFSLVNYARFIDVNVDNALERTNQKFIRRFNFLEAGALEDGKALKEMSLEEMDAYWNKAKALENK